MEIRIGVKRTQREITLETPLSEDELRESVLASLTEGTPLEVKDGKGHSAIVDAGSIAYVELVNEELRRVGFLG